MLFILRPGNTNYKCNTRSVPPVRPLEDTNQNYAIQSRKAGENCKGCSMGLCFATFKGQEIKNVKNKYSNYIPTVANGITLYKRINNRFYRTEAQQFKNHIEKQHKKERN